MADVNTAMGVLAPPVGIPNMESLVPGYAGKIGRQDELRSQMTQIQPAIQKARQEIGEVPAIPAPAFEESPKAPELKPLSIDGKTVMAFAAMAALGGLGTRQPLTNAMNAFSAAIKGYSDGDQRMFDHAIKQFKIENDAVLQHNDLMSKRFDAAIKGREQTLEQKKSDLDLLLKQFDAAKDESKSIDESISKAIELQTRMGEFRVQSLNAQAKLLEMQQKRDLQPLEQEKLEADIARIRLDTEKSQRELEQLRTGGKLEAGQFRDENGRIQLVAGTSQYYEKADKHDKDARALESRIAASQEILQAINDFITDPNFKDVQGKDIPITGGMEAYAYSFMYPGVATKRDRLLALFSNEGLSRIRESGSPGTITEREWPLMQAQVASITPRMSSQNVIETLRNVVDGPKGLKSNVEVLQGYYTQKWQGDQFYNPNLSEPRNFSLQTGKKVSEPRPLPPVELLKEGHVTKMSDGSKWVLRNGVPVEVQ